MRFPLCILITWALVGPGVLFVRSAGAQVAADDVYVPLAPEDLQSLVAPVALYPDAMLAQILVACTYPNDIAAAVQYLDAGSDPNAIDDQGWDLSVAGVARYPDLLQYMNSNGDWMNSLGAAFLNQEADVMTAVQVLRGEALAAGNLVSNDQQQVVVDQGTIEIIPTDPQNIYPPIYDPTLVYQPPVLIAGGAYVPLIHFWHAIPCGVWLHHDLDWHDHAVYVGAWGVNRPWWNHDRAGGPLDYTHDRPGLFQSNANISVNIHNRVVNVRGGAWTRQSHDPQKPMPKFNVHAGARAVNVRPGTGYAPKGQVEHPGAGGISNYNHAPAVARQSARGNASREKYGTGVRAGPSANEHPSGPVNMPTRRSAVAAPVRSNPAPAAPYPAPIRAAPSPAPVRNEPAARQGAANSYGNGAAASHASSRGAASRAPSVSHGRR